ncbi:hypothetical protein [Advenella sp. S44]|uniref:hypothetical protein n=1 Tax=Advenella sp. S44 TaxID=1982755 RepID=UPI0012905273|nr:hypothetical protein [Advenella sp. S44]
MKVVYLARLDGKEAICDVLEHIILEHIIELDAESDADKLAFENTKIRMEGSCVIAHFFSKHCHTLELKSKNSPDQVLKFIMAYS